MSVQLLPCLGRRHNQLGESARSRMASNHPSAERTQVDKMKGGKSGPPSEKRYCKARRRRPWSTSRAEEDVIPQDCRLYVSFVCERGLAQIIWQQVRYKQHHDAFFTEREPQTAGAQEHNRNQDGSNKRRGPPSANTRIGGKSAA